MGSSTADVVCEERSILNCSFIHTLAEMHSQRTELICYTHTSTIYVIYCKYIYEHVHMSVSVPLPFQVSTLKYPFLCEKYINLYQAYRDICLYTVPLSNNSERISQARYYSIDFTATLELLPSFSAQYSQLQQHVHIVALHRLALMYHMHIYIHKDYIKPLHGCRQTHTETCTRGQSRHICVHSDKTYSF